MAAVRTTRRYKCIFQNNPSWKTAGTIRLGKQETYSLIMRLIVERHKNTPTLL